MWGSIVKALMTYVIKPLLIDLGKALIEWTKESYSKHKRKKDSKKKKEAHESAKTKKEQSDSFSKLP